MFLPDLHRYRTGTERDYSINNTQVNLFHTSQILTAIQYLAQSKRDLPIAKHVD
jgi:hypothetical protein